MNKKQCFFVLLGVGLFHWKSWGAVVSPALLQSVRTQAMGGASVALADDEYAVFSNPAGLAGLRKYTLFMGSVMGEVSNDLIQDGLSFLKAMENAQATQLNQWWGKNLYARVTGLLGALIPGFGVMGFYDQQIGLRLQEAMLLQGVFTDQSTRGIQMGLGFRVMKWKHNSGEIRLGIAPKVVFRSGGESSLSPSQILNLNLSTIRSSMTKTGIGYGADLGSQVLYRPWKKQPFLLQTALVFRDVGQTAFSNGVSPQMSNLVFGVAALYQGKDVQTKFAYDCSDLLSSMAFSKKNHLGLELKFPILSVELGMNQWLPTYGLGIDLGLIQVNAASYAQLTMNSSVEKHVMLSAMLQLFI